MLCGHRQFPRPLHIKQLSPTIGMGTHVLHVGHQVSKHLHHSLPTLLHKTKRTYKIGVNNPRLLLGPLRQEEDDNIQIHNVLHLSDQKRTPKAKKHLQRKSQNLKTTKAGKTMIKTLKTTMAIKKSETSCRDSRCTRGLHSSPNTNYQRSIMHVKFPRCKSCTKSVQDIHPFQKLTMTRLTKQRLMLKRCTHNTCRAFSDHGDQQ